MERSGNEGAFEPGHRFRERSVPHFGCGAAAAGAWTWVGTTLAAPIVAGVAVGGLVWIGLDVLDGKTMATRSPEPTGQEPETVSLGGLLSAGTRPRSED